jgi:hypothetical protein
MQRVISLKLTKLALKAIVLKYYFIFEIKDGLFPLTIRFNLLDIFSATRVAVTPLKT